MNPFTWPGPQFLGFFLVLAIAAIAVASMRWMRNGRDRGAAASATTLTSDPYAIAYLRGNAEEAIKVAIFNLVDRQVLLFSNDKLRQSRVSGEQYVRRALDKAIVRACGLPTTIKAVVRSPAVRKEAHAYRAGLAKVGYAATEDEKRVSLQFGFMLAGVLGGIAAIKVMVAFGQGRSNVGFLIFGTIVACVVVLAISASTRTRRGLSALGDLKTLMARARSNVSRLKPGGETNEALLLASVFGVHVLPDENFPLAAQMYPRSTGGDSGGGDTSSSSSCSSGCGGGGGCGGCGG